MGFPRHSQEFNTDQINKYLQTILYPFSFVMSNQNSGFLDLPIDAGRPLKVICIGAGYSGILTAIRLPQRIPNLELVIYEKNNDIGGTWYENRYVMRACFSVVW
jgi:hypothetical protein